jgi:quinol monooxygenase YgiN
LPAAIAELLGWLRGILPATRAGEGCVSVSVTRHQDDPNNFAFVERWDGRAHYARYFAWRGETGILKTLATLVDVAAASR